MTDPIDLNKEKYAIAGCGAGVDTISVLADGTVMPCRHMDITIGKYPDKSLKEIYRENTICRDIRAYEKYDNCSKCELSMICRGCLAMRYAMCGSIYTKEPYCWKEGYSIE